MRLARLLILILFGVVVVWFVARFAVPAIYPEKVNARIQFSSGSTTAPGTAVRQGLHFGATASGFDRTRYVYFRIGNKVWVVEFLESRTPLEQ